MDSPILTERFINSYRGKTVPWGFNGLGGVVYRRTYSRVKDDGTQEEWYETVARCVNGAQKIGAGYTKDEAERLFDHVFNLRCNFAGRMLWQLGTSTVERFGLASLLNCWFISMREPLDFCFLFEHLMLGGGVGFSVKREDIHELPRVKKGVQIQHKLTKDADFIVPDSREGWVKLLSHVVDALYATGKSFTYSTVLIRGAGEKIHGFGGTASGPTILINGIDQIVKVFQSREGKKLRSIDVLDVCNIIGSVVVAGNVRRSAEVAIGDPDDFLYLNAKRWDLGTIPNWRGMSNNSIYADSFTQISEQVWEGYRGNGEPYGLMNLPLSRTQGRLGESRRDECEGGNPCMEINLEDGEACNLAEMYLNNITSKSVLIDCAKLLYKTQKAIWTLPALYEKTTKVVRRNMRIGLGVTGVCQSLEKLEWLDDCYVELRAYDKAWSKERGWPESVKLTTVKPSGTLSLLGGATPGVHPAYARHYIRRVRMSSADQLVKVCRDAGYHVEYVVNFDGSEDHGTVVVEFPCWAGDTAIVARDMTAVQQLELVKRLQTLWSDNSVSVTVYYRPEELDAIKAWLKEHYKTSLKTVSFLLHSEHGFKQAPYSEITEAEYDATIAKVTPLTGLIDAGGAVLDVEGCAGGVCPIR